MTTTNTLDANKQLAVHWLELVGAGDVDAICALTAPEWTMAGGPPQTPTRTIRRWNGHGRSTTRPT